MAPEPNTTRSERYPTPPDEIPVEPIEWPLRLSQTLLRHENRCPRSAYYYVKNMGTGKSHPMDRGTLTHYAAETLVLDLIVNREESMVARRVTDNMPVDRAEEWLSMQTGALVDELRAKHSQRLHIPHEEADVARICTFHIAMGLDIDPESVLGAERKFVFELRSGWEVSVKADLITLPDDFGAQVDDYKTSIDQPARSEWSRFQTKVAALALLYGFPLDREECSRCGGTGADAAMATNVGDEREDVLLISPGACPKCGGRGSLEVRSDPVGGHLTWVRGREIYPRLSLQRDGSLRRNEETWTRLQLDEFRADLEHAGERITERLQSWRWPARRGSWCSECPGRLECPIAPEMRGYAGSVEDREHAGEMWQLALALKDHAGDLEAAVKGWAKESGESVVVGDLLWAWQTSEVRSLKRKGKTTDWDGFEEAVTGAVERGDPFVLVDWVRTSSRNEFRKTKLADQPQGEVPHVGDASERFGDDSPF